jgi:hypothetical protein
MRGAEDEALRKMQGSSPLADPGSFPTVRVVGFPAPRDCPLREQLMPMAPARHVAWIKLSGIFAFLYISAGMMPHNETQNDSRL